MNLHGNPETIPLGIGEIVVGRSPSCQVQLFDKSVSREHAKLVTGASGVTLLDLNSRFGTFVNGVQIKSTVLRQGDRVVFGNGRAYQLDAHCLVAADSQRGLGLRVNRIEAKEEKFQLTNVAFDVDPGSFVGILGPSGGGKSTLLKYLTSFRGMNAGDIQFLLDGEIRCVVKDRGEYRKHIGFVSQKDSDYEYLTVGEYAKYASDLLAVSNSLESRCQINEEAITKLRMAEFAGKRCKHLSGGQRKRVNVAIELLRNPKLVLLDEPTAGLDPATEAILMENLRQLANLGTTVVCTTHLMDNLFLFDRLIVLGTVGRVNGLRVNSVVYVGPAADLLGHFHAKYFADLFERLENGPNQEWNPVGAATTAGKSDVTLEKDHDRSALAEEFSIAALKDLIVKDGSSSLRQFTTIAGRTWNSIRRDGWLLASLILQPIALGLLATITQYHQTKSDTLGFLIIVICIWLGLNNSARSLISERANYVRERLIGLRPLIYLGSKSAVLGGIGLAQVLSLLLCVGITSSFVLRADAGNDAWSNLGGWRSISTILVCAKAYLSGSGLGMLISIWSKSEASAVALMPLLIMPQLLLSSVAAGWVGESGGTRNHFAPFVVMIHPDPDTSLSGLTPTQDEVKEWWVGATVDVLSLACYSRPASMLLNQPALPEGYKHKRGTVWFGDFVHLAILVGVTWVSVYYSFRFRERYWPKHVGMG